MTGASSGIGRATAIAFAEEGAKVVLADLGDMNETISQFPVTKNQSGGEPYLSIKCNIAKREDVVNLIKTTIDTFGHLDCAVNCAGIAGKLSLPVHEYPEEEWLNQIQINLIGTY